MQIETGFNLGDKCHITELNRPGRIVGMYISEIGIQYQVRYFADGSAQTVYFFHDELQKDKK